MRIAFCSAAKQIKVAVREQEMPPDPHKGNKEILFPETVSLFIPFSWYYNS